MNVRAYVVRPGDTLSSIARGAGFASWRALYELPENAAFRQRRSNPHLLWVGDVLWVPARNEAIRRLGGG